MATNINTNSFETFIMKKLGTDHLTKQIAQKFNIDNEKFEEANLDQNDYLDLDEIINDPDLFNNFAVMYQTELDTKDEVKDKDKEKEKQTAIQDKNQAGV